MSTLLLALAAAAQAPDAAPALPDQRGLYRILFEDIHTTLAGDHTETGIFRTWTQGYDVNIADLDCTQAGQSANCRFRLTRTPDGTPRDIHAGNRQNAMSCRVELRYARGPDNAPEAWRVRTWPGLGDAANVPRSTMRCGRDRGAGTN
jgi:hypothetical protein